MALSARTTPTARFRKNVSRQRYSSYGLLITDTVPIPLITAIKKLHSHLVLDCDSPSAYTDPIPLLRTDTFQVTFSDNTHVLIFQPFTCSKENHWLWTGQFDDDSSWLMADTTTKTPRSISDLPLRWMRDKTAQLPSEQKQAVLSSFGCLQTHPQAICYRENPASTPEERARLIRARLYVSSLQERNALPV